MTTQSKSVLMPFLIIAGIVFAVALAWKFLGNHDKDSTVKSTEINISAPVKSEKTSTPTAQTQVVPEIVEYYEPEPFLEPTAEDVEVLREEAKNSMKFAMRYPTLDKAMDALKQYRANGNDESAESLIRYIEITFPNDMIPVELLD